MPENGVHSYSEITNQRQGWESAITASLAIRAEVEALLKRARSVVFVGCGSTHYLSQFAAPFYQAVTGVPARGIPSSQLLLFTDTVVAREETPSIVALSRSGATSETILAVEKMRRLGSEALAIGCYSETGLSAACNLTIEIAGGREQSFAQTRSFAGMLVASQMLSALRAGDEALVTELSTLPSLAERLAKRADDEARKHAIDLQIQRVTFLGSGPLYGLASEATVKMKEMSLTMAEPYRFMEFRHGPMALVGPEHLVVGLVSDTARDYEVAVLADLMKRGARVIAIANSVDDLTSVCHAAFPLGSAVSEASRAVLYLPFLQYMAYHRAMHKNLNPDRPRNVVMSIRLDGTEMV